MPKPRKWLFALGLLVSADFGVFAILIPTRIGGDKAVVLIGKSYPGRFRSACRHMPRVAFANKKKYKNIFSA